MAPAQSRNLWDWQKAYFHNQDRSLSESKATMGALMVYADFNDLTCYPSQAKLAKDTGLSTDTVGRHISMNVKAGWIEVLERGVSGKRATRYRLSTPRTDAESSGRSEGTAAGQLPAPVRPTPRTHAGSTPRTSAVPTTHRTNQVTTEETTQPESPLWGGPPGDISPIATTHVPTPRTDAGSSGGTTADPLAELWPDPFGGPPSSVSVGATPWPRDKPIPRDPWGWYVDEETGEEFEFTPGELPKVKAP